MPAIETRRPDVVRSSGARPTDCHERKSNKNRALRFDRSYEFDSITDRFPDFVTEELLPAVENMRTRDGRPIVLSKDGNDAAVMGASTGGIGSFTLAWRRPDRFTRVYSEIGTFVSMRGGNEYPALVRKTDPKPIRVFLEDGSNDAWNPLFGSWFEANLKMDSALTFAGYDEAHAWGEHGHDGKFGQAVLPDVMRWLWRDYPARVKPGRSGNSTLQELTVEDEGWQEIPSTFQNAAALAADATGEVHVTDSGTKSVYRVSGDGHRTVFYNGVAVTAAVFGPNQTLYGLVPSQKSIIAINPHGKARAVVEGITGRRITGTPDGTLYVSEPGAHGATRQAGSGRSARSERRKSLTTGSLPSQASCFLRITFSSSLPRATLARFTATL